MPYAMLFSHHEEPMNFKNAVILTRDEGRRLARHITKLGGQVKASIFFEVAPSTLSRNINGHTAPSPALRAKFAESGIVKK